MIHPVQQEYINNPAMPPDDDSVPFDQKPTDKEWFLRKARWLLSSWWRSDTYVPYGTVQKFAELRAYANGTQPNTKYMDWICPKKKDGTRKSWMNISWDTVPLHIKYLDILNGRLMKLDFASRVECLDDDIINEKNMMKFQAYVKSVDAEFLSSITEAAGLDQGMQSPEQANLPFVPRTLQDLDILANMGSFKHASEIVMQKLLNKTQKQSEWEEIHTRLITDAVQLGFMAAKDFNNPVTGKPEIRYCDPEFCIIRYDRDRSFKHIAEAGEIVFMTIKELKEWGVSGQDLIKAAQMNATYYGNSAYNVNSWTQAGNVYDVSGLYLFKIPVLDMDFESFSDVSYEYRDIDGQEVPFELKNGVPTSKKNKTKTRKYSRRYRGKWVIGTDVMFDYGYQYDVVYNSQNRPISPFHFYRVADRSIVDRMISTIDEMQLAIFRFRNAWAKARPSGLAIEWGSLAEITMEGKKLDTMDILTMLRENGDFLYKIAMRDGRLQPTGNLPVTELKGGMGPILNEFLATFQMLADRMRELTSVGNVVDGNVPSGDTLVGTSKIAEAATSDSIKHILNNYKRLKTRVMNNVILRWQIHASLFGVSETYSSKEGAYMEVVKLGFDDGKRNMEFIAEQIVDDDQKAILIQAAQTSLAAAKTGSAGINMSDFFYILDAVSTGQLRYAQVYLSYREQQEKDRQQALIQANQQANTQGAMAVEQQKAQNAQAAVQADMVVEDKKSQNKIQQINAQGNVDLMLLQEEYRLKAGLPVKETAAA